MPPLVQSAGTLGSAVFSWDLRDAFRQSLGPPAMCAATGESPEVFWDEPGGFAEIRLRKTAADPHLRLEAIRSPSWSVLLLLAALVRTELVCGLGRRVLKPVQKSCEISPKGLLLTINE